MYITIKCCSTALVNTIIQLISRYTILKFRNQLIDEMEIVNLHL